MKKVKFIKGMLIGTGVALGAVAVYHNMNQSQKKKIMKQGRKMIRKMGII